MVDLKLLVDKYEKGLAPLVERTFKERLIEIDAELNSLVGHLLEEKQLILDYLSGNKEAAKEVALPPLQAKRIEDYPLKASNIDRGIYILKKNGWLTLNDIANKMWIAEGKSGDVNTIKGTLSAIFKMEINKGDKSRLQRRTNANEKLEYMAK